MEARQPRDAQPASNPPSDTVTETDTGAATRRAFLQRTAGASAVLLLAACQTPAPSAPASPAAAAAPTAPSAATKPAASPVTAPVPSAAASPVASPAARPSPSAIPSASPAVARAGGLETLDSLQPLSPPAKFVLSAPFADLSPLAFYVAADRGYFQRAGLDVTVDVTREPANGPTRLARGDTHIAELNASPALFNSYSQGFDLKTIAGTSVPTTGRKSTAWVCVNVDNKDKFQSPADLKGKTIEAVTPNGPADVIASEMVRQQGWTVGQDVTLTYRVKAAPDLLALANNHAADAYVFPEPLATLAEAQNAVVRWIPDSAILSWYRPDNVTVTADYLTNNRPAVVKFLEVYVLTLREINATNGQWAPWLADIATARTDTPADVLRKMGGVPYFDPNGFASVESFQRIQEFWVERKQVAQPVDIARVIDHTPLEEALAKIGRA